VLAVLDALKARQLKTYDDHERPQDDEDFWIGKTKRELLKRLHHWVRAGEAKKAFPQLCPAITRKVNHGDTAASEPPPSTFESTPVDRMGGPAETREPQGDLPLRGKALTKGLEAWGRSLPELPGRDELYNIARMQPGFAYVTYADIKHLRTKLASETSKRGGAGMHSKRRPKLDKPGK
jgi:hypothetical protein